MGRSYTVQSGDNLSTIARNNNTTVDELMRLNPSITNANLIYAGSVINLPDTTSGSSTQSDPGTVTGGGSLPVNGTRVNTPSGSGIYSLPNTTTSQDNTASSSRLAAMEEYLANAVGEAPTESEILTDLRDQILNRGSFSYDPNTDPSWGQYLDSAKRRGKIAMQDTMGQNAALTGGYANSWAQSAGQQAYNQYIQDANEMMPEFEQLARARYEAETNALNNKYSLLYGEHRDSVSDWETRYDIAREDWYEEQDRLLAEEQEAKDEFWRQAEYLYQIGDWDALDSLGFDTTNLRTINTTTTDTTTTTTTNGSGNADDDEEETTENSVKLWNYFETTSGGNYVYYFANGSKKTVSLGVNPYNGKVNDDILDENGRIDATKLFKNKTGDFSNTYQPNNVDGEPLTKTGERYNMNGRDQAIWQTPDGRLWVWDGTTNEYFEIEIVD